MRDRQPQQLRARAQTPKRAGGRALALCVAALLLVLGAPLAFAGPKEDATTQATSIQQSLDDGNPAAAEALARTALAQARVQLGEGAPETANLSRLLGDTLYDQQRYGDAEPFFRKALAIREAVLDPVSEDVAHSATDLALTLKELGRHDEAEPLYRQALRIREALVGPEHMDVAKSLLRLSRLFSRKGDYASAAVHLTRAVSIAGKALGEGDRTTVLWTGELAQDLHDAGDLAAAEPVYRRALAAAEATFASQEADLEFAAIRQGLATLLRQTRRFEAAEPLYRLVLPARLGGLGPGHPLVAATREGLGRTLESLGRAAEASEQYRLALAIREGTAGPDSQAAADLLMRLGVSLVQADRGTEAEPVLKRLLDLAERTGAAHGPLAAEASRWIGRCLERLDREAEAEVYYRRALAIGEKANGSDHILTGYDLLALGMLYNGQQRLGEAEPLLGRAVAIMDALGAGSEQAAAARTALFALTYSSGKLDDAAALAERALVEAKASGRREADIADLTLSLAFVRFDQGKAAEAAALATAVRAGLATSSGGARLHARATGLLGRIRLAESDHAGAIALFQEAVAQLETLMGEDSPALQSPLADLGRAFYLAGEFEGARLAFQRSVAITETYAAINAATALSVRTGRIEDAALSRAGVYDFLLKSYHRLTLARQQDASSLSRQAFLVAQRVIDSRAAEALAQLSARQSAGSGELAGLVRQRQDLVERWQIHDRHRTDLLALAPDARPAAEMARLDAAIDTSDAQIRAIDAALVERFPDFASLQKPAALDFTAVQERLAEDEVLLFYSDATRISKDDFETYLWAVPKRGEPLWLKLAQSPGELGGAIAAMRDLMGVGPQARGASALKTGSGADRKEQVIRIAARLHEALLAPVAAMIEEKALVIVPSRKLSGLPFHMLVSGKPSPASSSSFQTAHWVVRNHAITILPSVSAMVAGNSPAPRDAARHSYLGFADPLLTGRSGEDRRAFARQSCDTAPSPLQVASVGPSSVSTLMRGGAADVDAVRKLEPLPETTDEVCAVARRLGVGEESLRLGAAATEAEVKRLSLDGRLAQAGILHFATHGLVSGDLQGLAEPAIVLTPPEAASDRDDGLLTASEVTTLRLDADWVILSACNTAAGEGGGEALSGLARAFFYAGARSLMVSHWPVNSQAAVSLATGAIDAMTDDPSLEPAEALRQAMLAEIDKGGSHADPANWAPFITVGSAD